MRALAALAAVTALAGCEMDGFGGTSRQAIFGATSHYELADMGGVKLTGDEITAAMAGKTFVEPNEGWSWAIDADGTQMATDPDGAWADADGTWEVADDRFCRENEGAARSCMEVWKVGKFLRFTDPDGALYVWTVTES